MTLDHLADVAAELARIERDSLGEMVAEVRRTAETHEVSVVRATVDVGGVTLDAELDAAEVIRLAASTGARLVYLDSSVVDAGPLIESIRDSETAPAEARLHKTILREVKKLNGFTSRVEIGFAHAGIVHTWDVDAPWAELLDEMYDGIETMDDDEPAALTSDEIDRLATELASDPAFRMANRHHEYEEATQRHPAITQLAGPGSRWQIITIMRQAQKLLDRQRIDLENSLEERLNELAASLARTPDFRAARIVGQRRKITQRWLAEHHTDGLRMPNSFVDQLEAVARDHPGDQLGFV